MIVYLDTSIVLRVLLGQKGSVRDFGNWSEAYSSVILKVEVRRVIDRLRLDSALNDEDVARAHEELRGIEEALSLIGLSPQVLRKAADPMPTVVKTLDAIHLASAVLLAEKSGSPPVFATHDRQQSTAARALGFICIG